MGKRTRSNSNAPRRKRRKVARRRKHRIGQTLIPKTKMVSLVYSGTFTLGNEDSALGHLIHANGMYDPDQAIGGHQPLGFDQWMAFYYHYEVISSKITFWIETAKEIDNSGTYATLRIDNNTGVQTTGSTYLNQSIERPSTSVVFIPPSSGGAGRRSISKAWSQRAVYGSSARGNAAMKGDVDNNPAEDSFFRLKLTNSKGSDTNLYTSTVVFRVTYLAQLTERKDITQS